MRKNKLRTVEDVIQEIKDLEDVLDDCSKSLSALRSKDNWKSDIDKDKRKVVQATYMLYVEGVQKIKELKGLRAVEKE